MLRLSDLRTQSAGEADPPEGDAGDPAAGRLRPLAIRRRCGSSASAVSVAADGGGGLAELFTGVGAQATGHAGHGHQAERPEQSCPLGN